MRGGGGHGPRAGDGATARRAAPNPDSQYRLGPDSLPQEGVPKGEIRGPFTLPSQVYPGTQHTYWVYVPAQYDPAVPAALMVFQDGQAFKDEKGDMRAQNVMDNLIYRREIPVMIGVFINPGRRPDQPEPTPAELGRPGHQPADRVQLARRQVRPGHHRGADAGAGEGLQHLEGPGDARDRRVELRGDRGVHGRLGAARPLPQGAEQRRQLRQPAGRARLPGEGAGEPRRSRSASTCATGGTTTAGSANGEYDEKRDWFYQNVRLMKALTQKGYDVNYSWGMNSHGQKFGGAILPEMMRWLWRDGPVSTDPKDKVERAFRQPAAKKN